MINNRLTYTTYEPVTPYQRAIWRLRNDWDYISVGAFIAGMEIIGDDAIGTAATDCVRKIIYSPAYMLRMEMIDKFLPTSVLIHEAEHKMQAFFPRFERWVLSYPGVPRKQLLSVFNIAADYFVNWRIKHVWGLPIHDGWYYRPDFSPHDYTTEGIANYLMQKPEDIPPPPPQCTSPGDGEAGAGGKSETAPDDAAKPEEAGGKDDKPSEGKPDDPAGENKGDQAQGKQAGQGNDTFLPAEYEGDIDNVPSGQVMREMEMELRQDTADAIRSAQGAMGAAGCGEDAAKNDPFMQEMQQVFEPGFDFYGALAEFANETVRAGKWSWFKPNYRIRTSQGLPMPGRHGKELGTAVFIIDSSGSTVGPICRYYLDETLAALVDLDYERAVVIWCDACIQHVSEYTKEQAEAMESLYEGKVHGGGGTSLHPALQFVLDEYEDAACVTYFTDGRVNAGKRAAAAAVMEEMTTIPVLWMVDNRSESVSTRDFIRWVDKETHSRVAILPTEVLNAIVRGDNI